MHDRLDALVATADPAMVIVTASSEGERAGCLVGFHSQSSIEPWRYCVWLSQQNHTYRVARRATYLAVHFLGADHRDLAERFGGTTNDEQVDKFADIRWSAAPDGHTPRLDDVPHSFLGRIVTHHDGDGDHSAFVLAAEDAWGTPPDVPLRLGDASTIEPGHPA